MKNDINFHLAPKVADELSEKIRVRPVGTKPSQYRKHNTIYIVVEVEVQRIYVGNAFESFGRSGRSKWAARLNFRILKSILIQLLIKNYILKI